MNKIPRYIDAEKLLNSYIGNILTAKTDYAEGCRDIIEDIKNAPNADVQEVKHGHWIIDENEGTVLCSACRGEFEDRGDTIPDYWSFCPKCGAKMDERNRK